MTLESSWGTITVDDLGNVINVDGEKEIDGEHNYLHDIESVDLEDFAKFLKTKGQKIEDSADILAVNLWMKDGTYEKCDDTSSINGSKSWREEMYYDLRGTEHEFKN